MFNNFSEEARKTILLAKEEMKDLKHPYVSSEHLLLAILKGKNNITLKLKKYNLDYNIFKNEVIKIIGIGKKTSEWILYTPMFKSILEKAIIISNELNDDVKIEHLFQAIIDEGEGIAIRILMNLNINLDDLYSDFVCKNIKKNKKKKTLLLELGKELTNLENINQDPVIGRDKEIKRVMEILTRRNKNNPLLIGDAGVGKTAIVEELSRRIINNEVPQKLMNKKIISLDMSSLVAGTKYRGEFEEKINKILKEVEENDDIILFIDEIHTLVGAGGAEGAIDAANIFKPALARNKIKVIGATTITEYKKYMENDKALERRFQTVLVEEPTKEVVKDIIKTLKPIYETYHKVNISDTIIDKIIEYSSKYIKNRKEPDRTIDILDEVCSHTNLKENKNLEKYNEFNKELYKIIQQKKDAIINDDYDKAAEYKEKENNLMSKINELELKLSLNNNRKVTLNDLEEVLINKVKVPRFKLNLKFNKQEIVDKITKKIYGQDDKIKELVNGYSNSLNDNNCYGILLTGPTGIGKTKTSLLFANAISYNQIRLDMSEFSEAHTISKLIGAPAGYVGYSEPAILEKLNHYPFTVLILDEIEKCHSSILNLFFQALDNNLIKSAKGDDIYFNNVIIIMTSNIYSKNSLGFNKNSLNKKNYFEYFSKPFMNRINKIIEFNELNKDDIIKIVKNYCKGKVRLTKQDLESVILKSDYKNFGARQIPYIIKEYLDNEILV